MAPELGQAEVGLRPGLLNWVVHECLAWVYGGWDPGTGHPPPTGRDAFQYVFQDGTSTAVCRPGSLQ